MNTNNEPDFYEKRLETLEKLFLNRMVSKFKTRVNPARDKNLVIKEELKNYMIQLFFCFEKDMYVKMLLSDFWWDYSCGNIIDGLIIRKSTEFQEAFAQGAELPDTIKKFKNPYRLINFFSKYVAFYKFNQLYKQEHPEIFDQLEVKLKIKIPNRRIKNKYYYDPKHAHLVESNIAIEIPDKESPNQLIDQIIEIKEAPLATNLRQIMAMRYIFDELKLNNIDELEKARFIIMLTGKSINTTRGILSGYEDPKTEVGQLKDLEFLLAYFKGLGLQNIENKILSEIKTLNKDIENQRYKKN